MSAIHPRSQIIAAISALSAEIFAISLSFLLIPDKTSMCRTVEFLLEKARDTVREAVSI
jgi:hypothetical protein